eukprot:TRINITY_DN3139_c0_g1_i2.p1 TRINITY_DN3139_c0_g1~~TRINITY_DN3139_c0_g1_i2.p1  ORF type:complete len:168 (+),score=39.16 TRINITY_DN3139_c0_g1_i2:543-1046(+)
MTFGTPDNTPQTHYDLQLPQFVDAPFIKLPEECLTQELKPKKGEKRTEIFSKTQNGKQNVNMRYMFAPGCILNVNVWVRARVMSQDFIVKELEVGMYGGKFSLKRLGGGHRNSILFIEVTNGIQTFNYYYGLFNAYSHRDGIEWTEPTYTEEIMLDAWNNRYRNIVN